MKKSEPTKTLISLTKRIIWTKPRCTKLPEMQDRTIRAMATVARRPPRTVFRVSLLRIVLSSEDDVDVVDDDGVDVEEEIELRSISSISSVDLVNGSTVLDVFVIFIPCICYFKKKLTFFVCVF